MLISHWSQGDWTYENNGGRRFTFTASPILHPYSIGTTYSDCGYVSARIALDYNPTTNVGNMVNANSLSGSDCLLWIGS